jgi:hypothetical protein
MSRKFLTMVLPVAAGLLATVPAPSQASINIAALDTGAGLFGINNNSATLVDPNWTVSLVSSSPTETPPGGTPTGAAYLVPNNIGFPFGYWVPNDATSSWLTYSTPTQVDGDNTGDTYRYQLIFTAANTCDASVRWLSDNSSWLYLNGVQIGTRPSNSDNSSTYGSWNTPVDLGTLIAGTKYTVDLDVYNIPQGNGNPTGARVEFSGNVSVVPEPTTMLAGALLLLPFGASTIRILRRNRAA